MSNSAVILATWCPSEKEFATASLTLDAVIKNFPSSDIYVGINPPFYDKWLSKVKSLGPNVKVSLVPECMSIDSDASAFLTAVDLYNLFEKTYDYVFIGHTKDASKPTNEMAKLFIAQFWEQQEVLCSILDLHPKIGAVYPFATFTTEPVNKLPKLCKAPYEPVNLMSSMGFMLMKGELFDKFAKSLPVEMFTQSLQVQGFDRWLLERDVAAIPGAFGYVPLPLRLHNHQNVVVRSANDYNDFMTAWAKQNSLWIPNVRYAETIEDAFIYCPKLWRIEAMNLENKEIPPMPSGLMNAPPAQMQQLSVPNFQQPINNAPGSNPWIQQKEPARPVENVPATVLPDSFRQFLNNDKAKTTTAVAEPPRAITANPNHGCIMKTYLQDPSGFDALTDKQFAHNYLEGFYDNFFKPLENVPFKMLEIGTYKGGSLKLWREALLNAKIFSIDNNPQLPFSEWGGPNWQVIKLDAVAPDSVQKVKDFIGMLDVIIDDGSHTEADQLFTLENYFDLLLPGGTLIIEDVQSMPRAMMMQMKYPDIKIIDLRDESKGTHHDAIMVVRQKPGI